MICWRAARFTNTYIRLVGQTPAPGKCVLLSTSSVVRALMRDWVLSDTGDKWTVKLDDLDLGGHLGTTYRRRAATLAGRVLGLLAAVLVVMALPPDFVGKLRSSADQVSAWRPACYRGLKGFFLPSPATPDRMCLRCLVQKDAFGACWGYFVFVGRSAWL